MDIYNKVPPNTLHFLLQSALHLGTLCGEQSRIFLGNLIILW
jgi:hypothetical protein